jgi:hypothetical protein
MTVGSGFGKTFATRLCWIHVRSILAGNVPALPGLILFAGGNMRTKSQLFQACMFAVVLGAAAQAGAQGLTPQDDMNSPQNGRQLMPNAARGSEYPSHGNQQAGEMNLNPTDPRAQLVNGLPNNTQAGGYGSPLAGVRTYVPQTPAN